MKSLSLSKPRLITMVGLPGSGKTFFAKRFSTTFHAPYISFEELAEFTSSEKALVNLVTHLLGELMKTHQSIVVDGFAHTKAQRALLRKVALENDYEFLLIWTQTDPHMAKYRSLKPLKGSGKKALTDAEYEKRQAKFMNPSTTENALVLSGMHTYATQAKIVLTKLSAGRRRDTESTTPPPTSPRSEPPVESTRRILIR